MRLVVCAVFRGKLGGGLQPAEHHLGALLEVIRMLKKPVILLELEACIFAPRRIHQHTVSKSSHPIQTQHILNMFLW